jgi:2-oxoglutarate ferredoxin oxidoreductase subunit delta
MGYVEIDQGRCKGCQLCVTVCPRQLIALATRVNQLGYHPAQLAQSPPSRGCTGCVLCGLVCPETAIAVYR